MQEDFHYYATYCAAFFAGFSHEESLAICSADQFVDLCTATLLRKLKAPVSAATTQSQGELVNQRTDLVGLQEVTRIWAAFHFLPYDLHAEGKKRYRAYTHKYRLICRPNGELVKKTVELARGKGCAAIGLAMHVLADTWAHAYFAGTPSMVINSVDFHFYELLPEGDSFARRKILFNNNPGTPDDPDRSYYTNSMSTSSETSIMNLGHGRVGHLPDYSYARYEYMPAWMNYNVVVKDNPSDYYHAFAQMVYALRYLRGDEPAFETGRYAFDVIAPHEETIRKILGERRLNACEEWKAFGESLSGCEIPPCDMSPRLEEYLSASGDRKDSTYIGSFLRAAQAQKSMVSAEIFRSGSLLAGFSFTGSRKGGHR